MKKFLKLILICFFISSAFNSSAQTCISGTSLVHSPGGMNDMKFTSDGQIVTAGLFNGQFIYQGDTLQSAGNYSAYILIMDSAYNRIRMLRALTFFGSGSVFNQSELYHIAVDENKNIILCGTLNDSMQTISNMYQGDGAGDGYVSKFDSLGNEIFTKTFGSYDLNTGFHGQDYIRDVAVDTAGNIYSIGSFEDKYLPFDNDTLVNGGLFTTWGTQVFVVSLNPAGNLNWMKECGSHKSDDDGYYIAVSRTGNVVISGITATGNNMFHIGNDSLLFNAANSYYASFIATYDLMGNELWVHQIQPTFNSGDADIMGIGVDDLGNTYAMGFFNGSHALFDLDSVPALLYETAFLVKYDNSGIKKWIRTGEIDDPYPYPACIAVRNSKIIISGHNYSNQSHFGAFGIEPGANIYIACYDSNGVVQWARGMDADPSGDIGSVSAVIDNDGHAYISGGANGTISIYPFQFYASSDWFILKLDTIPSNNLTASILLNTSDTITCGHNVTFNASYSPTTDSHLTWTSNSPSFPSAYIYNLAGDFPLHNSYYILSVLHDGCTVMDTVNITVLPLVVSAGTDTAFCAHDTIQLNGTFVPGALYKWLPATGLNYDSIYNPFVHINAAINYIYQVTLHTCVATDTISLNVFPDPVASFTYSQNNLTINLTNTSQNISSFYWDFNDGITDSINSNTTHQYNNSGTYNVCLITENNCGSDSVCHVFNVTNVGIENLNACNPSLWQDGKRIQFNCNGCLTAFNCSIFDLDGRCVYSKKQINCFDNIDVGSANLNGIYIMEISTDKTIYKMKLSFF